VSVDARVAVIGGGVVGCAVAHSLARQGVAALLLEAEQGLALGASGANSGILHTGFDSPPGELETKLILRAAALRERLLDELGVAVWRCGACLAPDGEQERQAVARLHENARRNGVETTLEDGVLTVPGESVSDPVAFVHALAAAAEAGGATVTLGARVCALSADPAGAVRVQMGDGRRLRANAVVNCAGLYADDVARMAGEERVEIYPRKGEFLVFEPDAEHSLQRILLPVPSARGKGVLVFPTLDGHVIAGPTAREREDKRDWSVEADAAELILPGAQRMYPPLALGRQVGAYAGLRPAGRDGVNYLIDASHTLPGLFHVAAIRSTGLSASLAIGEHVSRLLAARARVRGSGGRPLPAPRRPAAAGPWWDRAARHHASAMPGRPRS
jgi:glycerol-3-phosphate dehydrogenase